MLMEEFLLPFGVVLVEVTMVRVRCMDREDKVVEIKQKEALEKDTYKNGSCSRRQYGREKDASNMGF
jgi:hypothetical protein